MHIQNSYQESDKGTLYVVPTPIGNLEDMTIRALHTLKSVDLIAAEDTRHTQKLLNHFEIKSKLMSYHEHNKMKRSTQLIDLLEQKQNIALVSDAGMPAISDPGSDIVKEAIEKDIPVVVLPGANAALCALVGSGLPTDAFHFYGFLPRKKREIEKVLESLKSVQATLIFYESPYRVKDTLQAIDKGLGNRQIVIAREITKVFEQFIRGNVEEVIEWIENNEIKGECCILVDGMGEGQKEDTMWWESLSIQEHVSHYEETKQMTNKQAMKQVAIDRNISRREVYQHIHVEK